MNISLQNLENTDTDINLYLSLCEKFNEVLCKVIPGRVNPYSLFTTRDSELKKDREELIKYYFEKQFIKVAFIKVDDQIAGYVIYSLGFDDIEYSGNDLIRVSDLFIIDDYQGKGIGKKVLQMLQNELKTDNIVLMVNKKNIPAIGFYKKLGFGVVDTCDFMYLESEL